MSGAWWPLDFKRLAIFSLVGGAYIAPAVHYWFGFLDSVIKKPAISKRYVNLLLPPMNMTEKVCVGFLAPLSFRRGEARLCVFSFPAD